MVDPNSIVIRDNKAYAADGEQIDLIYRRFTADELPKFAKKSWQMAIDWDKADVAVVNPFCTKRVDSKNIMVLFKDEQYDDVFPEELKSRPGHCQARSFLDQEDQGSPGAQERQRGGCPAVPDQ